MSESSRRNAQTWPYPRHRDYEKQLRKSNAEWFAERNYPVDPGRANIFSAVSMEFYCLPAAYQRAGSKWR